MSHDDLFKWSVLASLVLISIRLEVLARGQRNAVVL